MFKSSRDIRGFSSRIFRGKFKAAGSSGSSGAIQTGASSPQTANSKSVEIKGETVVTASEVPQVRDEAESASSQVTEAGTTNVDSQIKTEIGNSQVAADIGASNLDAGQSGDQPDSVVGSKRSFKETEHGPEAAEVPLRRSRRSRKPARPVSPAQLVPKKTRGRPTKGKNHNKKAPATSQATSSQSKCKSKSTKKVVSSPVDGLSSSISPVSTKTLPSSISPVSTETLPSSISPVPTGIYRSETFESNSLPPSGGQHYEAPSEEVPQRHITWVLPPIYHILNHMNSVPIPVDSIDPQLSSSTNVTLPSISYIFEAVKSLYFPQPTYSSSEFDETCEHCLRSAGRIPLPHNPPNQHAEPNRPLIPEPTMDLPPFIVSEQQSPEPPFRLYPITSPQPPTIPSSPVTRRYPDADAVRRANLRLEEAAAVIVSFRRHRRRGVRC